MRIGIDARMCGAKKNRGIGRYIEKLLMNLAAIDHENVYFVFLFPESKLSFILPENFRTVKIDIPWYSLAEQIKLPIILRKYNLDLIHFPHFNIPWLYSGRYLVTIHDLIMTHYAEDRSTTRNKFFYWIKIGLARKLVARAISKARLVIVPSEFTKNDILRHLGVEVKKLKVIYEGIDPLFEKKYSVLPAWKPTKPFFLYVGAAYPHKNLEFLVQSFREFNSAGTYQLVLVGPQDYFYQRLRDEYIKDDPSIITGQASDAQLAQLYRLALAFVFPSRIEGFGLPPLEAMQYGCPVIASRAASLPEIIGPAAVFFNPDDKYDLVAKLSELTESEKVREKYVQLGREQVKKFSWRKMAEQTKELYERSI